MNMTIDIINLCRKLYLLMELIQISWSKIDQCHIIFVGILCINLQERCVICMTYKLHIEV